MSSNDVEAKELKSCCNRVSVADEAGCTFYLLEGLRLPEGCQPSVVDALLCASPRDGYPSRIYFAQQVQCPFNRNWNTIGIQILGRSWNAFSWKVEPADLTLKHLLLGHLQGFTRC